MLFDPGRNTRERRPETGWIVAPRLRHVRPTTALAADPRRHLIDQFASVQAARQVLGHPGDERDFVLSDRSQHNGRR